MVLGGGSNLILPDIWPGTVLKNDIPGISIQEEDKNFVHIEVGGGVVWHDLVLWSLHQGYGGLENLALIPGTVGAAPIQNIGAYGVELQDVFLSLQALNLSTNRSQVFSREDCQFGYRQSIFKKKSIAGKFWISKIILRLTKSDHRINTSYGAIQQMLHAKTIASPTPADVAAAVIEIRRSKLPDWRKLGNTGSFFKNPIVAARRVEELKEPYPDIPTYPLANGQYKLAAGWLIDQAGWKGKQLGSVGCYEKQALVLVNHGGATQLDVRTVKAQIQADVEAKFGLILEPEVNILIHQA